MDMTMYIGMLLEQECNGYIYKRASRSSELATQPLLDSLLSVLSSKLSFRGPGFLDGFQLTEHLLLSIFADTGDHIDLGLIEVEFLCKFGNSPLVGVLLSQFEYFSHHFWGQQVVLQFLDTVYERHIRKLLLRVDFPFSLKVLETRVVFGQEQLGCFFV